MNPSQFPTEKFRLIFVMNTFEKCFSSAKKLEMTTSFLFSNGKAVLVCSFNVIVSLIDFKALRNFLCLNRT